MVVIIAHRGVPSEEPENTLESFARAVAYKADMVEMDIRLSSDGIPVVIHDATLKRIAGLPNRVAEMPLQAIEAIRINDVYKIPRLEEAVAYCQGKIRMNIEIKDPAAAAPVVKLLRQSGAERQSVVTSFDATCLKTIRQSAPEIETGLILGTRTMRLITRIKEFFPGPWARRLQVNELNVHYGLLHRLLVYDIHRSGLRLNVWIPLEEEKSVELLFRRIMQYRINGIITGMPHLLRTWLSSQQQKYL